MLLLWALEKYSCFFKNKLIFFSDLLESVSNNVYLLGNLCFGIATKTLKTLAMNQQTNVQFNQFVIITDLPSSLAPNPTSNAKQ